MLKFCRTVYALGVKCQTVWVLSHVVSFRDDPCCCGRYDFVVDRSLYQWRSLPLLENCSRNHLSLRCLRFAGRETYCLQPETCTLQRKLYFCSSKKKKKEEEEEEEGEKRRKEQFCTDKSQIPETKLPSVFAATNISSYQRADLRL